jgi:SAM-dependent methyltransferase
VTTREATESALVQRLQQVWEAHAQEDPLWAIISTPTKRGGQWDLNEFLATGKHEIAELLKTLAAHDIAFDPAAALDFGCGVGRLSQALAGHFESVCGVDISPTMIDTAEKLNQFPTTCRYFVNAADDLRLFHDGQFTFIYSNVVLQHIHPQISRRYIAEFGRITRPGGVVVFQLPSRYQVEEGLPVEAMAAAIAWTNPVPKCIAGTRHTLRVSVENVSSTPWQFDDRRAVMLGNHWLDATGNMVRLDDGRAMLPNGVAPGQRIELSIDVNTPPSAGRYILELDLVQEGVAWFGNKGSTTLREEIEVRPAAPKAATSEEPAPAAPEPAAAADDAASPVFEGFSMHCIPRAEVLDLMSRSGLRLEYIQQTDHAGSGYQSYVYFARKVA